MLVHTRRLAKTKIEWTDRTWNPTRGCSRVSEGCRHCYAEQIAGRFTKHALQDGEQDAGVFAGFAVMKSDGAHWTGKVELIPDKLEEPLHWRKPCRVFVNSMSDLFHEALPDEAIDRVFAVMALCPEHTFQVLTKRPERMLNYCSALETRRRVGILSFQMAQGLPIPRNGRPLPHEFRPSSTEEFPQLWSIWPLPNVWLGVSVEDQNTADERIPLLLQTPAAVRFVSYEPALGPVDFVPFLCPMPESVNWLIIGGESGPHARPFDIQWARDVIAQCKAAGVACFVKQLGRNPVTDGTFYALDIDKGHGGEMLEWPADLRVREFPA